MISNNLSKLLGEIKMSQSKLSKLTGIRRQTIADIYDEINITISMEQLDALCKVFDCEVGDIFVYTPPKNKS